MEVANVDRDEAILALQSTGDVKQAIELIITQQQLKEEEPPQYQEPLVQEGLRHRRQDQRRQDQRGLYPEAIRIQEPYRIPAAPVQRRPLQQVRRNVRYEQKVQQVIDILRDKYPDHNPIIAIIQNILANPRRYHGPLANVIEDYEMAMDRRFYGGGGKYDTIPLLSELQTELDNLSPIKQDEKYILNKTNINEYFKKVYMTVDKLFQYFINDICSNDTCKIIEPLNISEKSKQNLEKLYRLEYEFYINVLKNDLMCSIKRYEENIIKVTKDNANDGVSLIISSVSPDTKTVISKKRPKKSKPKGIRRGGSKKKVKSVRNKRHSTHKRKLSVKRKRSKKIRRNRKFK